MPTESRVMRRFRVAGWIVAALFLGLSSDIDPARAQDSRAAVIAQQQAQKTQQIAQEVAADPKPKRRRFFIPKVEPLSDVTNYLIEPRGFYPLVGSIYSGGGASFGGGYRWYYGDETALDIKGMYSI
jgi:hypothetical protein